MAIPRAQPSTRTIANPLCIFSVRSPRFDISSCSAAMRYLSNSRAIISSGGSCSLLSILFSLLYISCASVSVSAIPSQVITAISLPHSIPSLIITSLEPPVNALSRSRFTASDLSIGSSGGSDV